MKNREPKKIIKYDITEATQKAGISQQTRDVLVIKAGLFDVVESFYTWLGKYYIISDETTNKIHNSSSKLHKVIDEFLALSISDNMLENSIKDI